MDDRHPVSLRHGQTCFFMVFHTMLRQISNFCFCAISSHEFLSAFFSPFYPNYEKDVLIIFIYMYHKYFQTDLSSVISQVGTITKWDPSSNNQHFLSPSFSFSSLFLSNLINLTNLEKILFFSGESQPKMIWSKLPKVFVLVTMMLLNLWRQFSTIWPRDTATFMKPKIENFLAYVTSTPWSKCYLGK